MYNIPSTIGKGRSITIKSRINRHDFEETPGPGSYDFYGTLGKDGIAASIKGRAGKGGIELINPEFPGPGTYDPAVKAVGKEPPHVSLRGKNEILEHGLPYLFDFFSFLAQPSSCLFVCFFPGGEFKQQKKTQHNVSYALL